MYNLLVFLSLVHQAVICVNVCEGMLLLTRAGDTPLINQSAAWKVNTESYWEPRITWVCVGVWRLASSQDAMHFNSMLTVS